MRESKGNGNIRKKKKGGADGYGERREMTQSADAFALDTHTINYISTQTEQKREE